MKQGIAISLILLLLLSPMGKTGMVLIFKMNQDYIAQTECLLREIKENACQGHCQLSLQLAEAQQKEHEANMPHILKHKFEVLYTFVAIPSFLEEENQFPDHKNPLATNSVAKISTFHLDIFHPPQA